MLFLWIAGLLFSIYCLCTAMANGMLRGVILFSLAVGGFIQLLFQAWGTT